MPPNRDVMRRIKVDFPHPESAARPMTTGPSRAARVTTRARVARRAVVGFLATTGAARAAVANANCADMARGERTRACGRAQAFEKFSNVCARRTSTRCDGRGRRGGDHSTDPRYPFVHRSDREGGGEGGVEGEFGLVKGIHRCTGPDPSW